MKAARHLAALPAIAAGLICAAVPASADVGPAAIDPCQLLTDAEVSEAIGVTVEPGRFADNGITRDGARSTTCLWAVTLPPGVEPDPSRSLGGRQFAILNVINWAGGSSDAAKYLEGFRAAFEHGEISSRPVEIAIGADESLWWGDGVAARVEGVSLGMSVASADRPSRRARAETLAKLVVERLPAKPA